MARRSIKLNVESNALTRRRRTHRVDAGVDCGYQVTIPKVQMDFAGDDARHIKHFIDQFHLRVRALFDDIESFGKVYLAAIWPPQNIQPTRDCTERRSQLVTQGSQEL